jgi:hypothetical protein
MSPAKGPAGPEIESLQSDPDDQPSFSDSDPDDSTSLGDALPSNLTA